jgi:hypothetical protein
MYEYSTMTPDERIWFAIIQSIHRNETVKLYDIVYISTEALCECEVYCTEPDGSVQYWGTTDEGYRWSLQLYPGDAA